MARQPQVTRTCITTIAKILAVNLDTKETSFVEMTLPREYKDDDALLKMAAKLNTNKRLKLVAVDDTHTEKKLYGMSEAEFLKHAKVLPPRAVKIDENGEAYIDTDSVETDAPAAD